jgi:hypothetical protein
MFIYIHIMYMTVCAGPWELEPTAGAMPENGHQMWPSSLQMWLPSHANGRGEALILVPFSPLPASAMAPNFSPSRQILNRYHGMSTALHLSPENAWVTFWNMHGSVPKPGHKVLTCHSDFLQNARCIVLLANMAIEANFWSSDFHWRWLWVFPSHGRGCSSTMFHQ